MHGGSAPVTRGWLGGIRKGRSRRSVWKTATLTIAGHRAHRAREAPGRHPGARPTGGGVAGHGPLHRRAERPGVRQPSLVMIGYDSRVGELVGWSSSNGSGARVISVHTPLASRTRISLTPVRSSMATTRGARRK
jgi:hypothetical protein